MANQVTSNTGAAVSPVVTFKTRNNNEKVYLYVNYAKGDGTNVTMKIASVNKLVHATNAYESSVFATATIAPITATFDTTGKYRFEVALASSEQSLIVTFAFTGGTTQAVVCDFSFS